MITSQSYALTSCELLAFCGYKSSVNTCCKCFSYGLPYVVYMSPAKGKKVSCNSRNAAAKQYITLPVSPQTEHHFVNQNEKKKRNQDKQVIIF